jgi:glycosyltransferase involved in cell wall biosynthesis
MKNVRRLAVAGACFGLTLLLASCFLKREEGENRTILKAGLQVADDMAGWVALPNSEPKSVSQKDLSYYVLSTHWDREWYSSFQDFRYRLVGLMDRIIVEHLRRMPEHNLFVRGLRTWVGYRQIGYTYDREERAGGRTKYSLGKLFALAYDGLISFSFFPLRTAMRLGLLTSLASFLTTSYLIVKKLVFDIPLLGWTSTAVLILFMGGIQLFTVGIMGEYICRIFDEVKGRPLYIIREKKL